MEETTAGFQIGQIVVALAGREAGERFVVVGLDEKRLWLADGVKRRVGSPKKKNPRHVQRQSHAVPVQLEDGQLTDEAVRSALRSCKEGD
ncbi:MAG: KOW domain-containing protein [Patescibacteria group bacterium]